MFNLGAIKRNYRKAAKKGRVLAFGDGTCVWVTDTRTAYRLYRSQANEALGGLANIPDFGGTADVTLPQAASAIRTFERLLDAEDTCELFRTGIRIDFSEVDTRELLAFKKGDGVSATLVDTRLMASIRGPRKLKVSANGRFVLLDSYQKAVICAHFLTPRDRAYFDGMATAHMAHIH
jgi:hypothetical protein